MAKNSGPSSKEQDLMERILSFKYDPLGFVMYVFPWGVKGTPLEKIDKPRTWQISKLKMIGDQLLMNKQKIDIGLPPEPIYLAISSGRGPGKSAFLSMLELFVASCWIGATGIVTANTETQLRSRTMAELGKWHTMMINRHWFEKSSMSLKPSQWFAELIENQLQMDTQYYYIEGQSWSEENPDAFAGAHSQIGMLLCYDEASGISDAIWNVSEGFFTDMSPLRIWVVISNPRRNTGRFFDCFHKDKDFWEHYYIDSRTVEGVDPGVYQRIADKYGEDHDVTRIEVKGQFPRIGSNQFISRETVADATMRLVDISDDYPLMMGVDVARFGDDHSVVRFRKGRDARSIPSFKFRGLNTMELSDEVAHLINKYSPDSICIDGGGVGGGVVDRLRQMGFSIIEVQFGERARDPEKYINRRVEIWGEMREWLVYGAIDKDEQLVDDLTGPEYSIDVKGRLKLESKDVMKKRGLTSPDDGDALALTFSVSAPMKNMNSMKNTYYVHPQPIKVMGKR